MKMLKGVRGLFLDGLLGSSSAFYKWYTLVIAMLGSFIAVLDVSIVNVAQDTIIDYYGSSMSVGVWLANGYMLANILMLPVAGWLANRYGFKAVFIAGVVVFVLGSLVCGLSDSMSLLVTGRFMAGLGSGVVMPVSMALVTREFVGRDRGLALGLWATSTAAAVSLGPFIGGALLADYSWRSIFVVNIPIGVLILLCLFFVLREWRVEQRSRFDLRGLLLLWGWLSLMLVGLTYMDYISRWVLLLILVVAVVLFGLFVYYSFHTREPILDLRILRERNFGLSMVVMFFVGMFLYAGNYIFPLYAETVLHYTPFHTGLLFLPLGVIQGVAAPVSGVVSHRVGHKTLIIAGLVILAVYLAMSMSFDATSPAWLLSLSLYLRGLGNGLSFTVLNTLSLENIEVKNLAQASSMSNTIRQFSGAIGISLITLIIADHQANYISGVQIGYILLFVMSLLAIIPVLFMKTKK